MLVIKYLNYLVTAALLMVSVFAVTGIAMPSDIPQSLNKQVIKNNINTTRKDILAINQLIISTKKLDTNAQSKLNNLNTAQNLGITKIKTLAPNKIFKLKFDQNVNPTLINLLESQAWIGKVALNPIEKNQAIIQDPLSVSNPSAIANPTYSSLLSTLAPQVKFIPTIAVIDSAFDPLQGDLSPNMLSGIDFADGDLDAGLPNFYKIGTSNRNIINRSLFHGGMVSGVIASASNEIGTVGICPWCKIKPYKTSSDDDITQDASGNNVAPGLYQDSMIASIYHSISRGVKIINISAGSTIYSSVYQEVTDYARDQGVIMVASSGNNNSSNPFWPASFDSVISVGAINSNLAKSSYSSFGTSVDISIPIDNGVVTPVYRNNQGVDIWALNAAGTSFASPVVCGIIGLIYSLFPSITADQIRSLLKNPSLMSDLNPSNPNFQNQLGLGLIPGLFLGGFNSQGVQNLLTTNSIEYSPSRANLPGYNTNRDITISLNNIITLGVCQLYIKDYYSQTWRTLGSGCSATLRPIDRANIAYLDIKWTIKNPVLTGGIEELEVQDLMVFEFNGVGNSI